MVNRVFISGVSGLLGVSLAQAYRLKGFEVVGCKQKGTMVPEGLNDCTIHEGDINDYYFLSEVIKPGDLVIHCAALVSFDRKDVDKLFKINVEGTKNILQVALERKVSKFIMISSIAALGRPVDGSVITEKTLWEDSGFNTNYAKSKFESEVEFWRAHEEGLDGFVVNPAVILGRGELYSSSNKLFQNLFNKVVFVVNGAINVVDVRDLVSCILRLDDKGTSGKRFILNGHKVTIKFLMSELVKRSTLNNRVKEVPLLLAKVVRPFENFFSLVSGKKPNLTKETLKVLEAESTYDNNAIKNELDFQFRPLDDSLTWCCGYYVDKYG